MNDTYIITSKYLENSIGKSLCPGGEKIRKRISNNEALTEGPSGQEVDMIRSVDSRQGEDGQIREGCFQNVVLSYLAPQLTGKQFNMQASMPHPRHT